MAMLVAVVESLVEVSGEVELYFAVDASEVLLIGVKVDTLAAKEVKLGLVVHSFVKRELVTGQINQAPAFHHQHPHSDFRRSAIWPVVDAAPLATCSSVSVLQGFEFQWLLNTYFM